MSDPEFEVEVDEMVVLTVEAAVEVRKVEFKFELLLLTVLLAFELVKVADDDVDGADLQFLDSNRRVSTLWALFNSPSQLYR